MPDVTALILLLSLVWRKKEGTQLVLATQISKIYSQIGQASNVDRNPKHVQRAVLGVGILLEEGKW